MYLKNFRKIVIGWNNWDIYLRLVLVFLLGMGFTTVFTSCILLNIQCKQLKNTAIKETTHTVELHQKELALRMDIIEHSTTNLASYIKKHQELYDMEDRVTAKMKDLNDIYKQEWSYTYYDNQKNNIIYVSKSNDSEIKSFDKKYIDRLSKTKEGEVVTNTNRDTGIVHIGTPIYDKDNSFVGAIIVTSYLDKIFPEIPDVDKSTKVYRAIIDRTGNYIWKYNNYKQKYPNNKNIKEDITDFFQDPATEKVQSLINNNNVVAYAPVETSTQKVKYSIVQITEKTPEMESMFTLKRSFLGASLGYGIILSGIFLFVARIIRLELKIRVFENQYNKDKRTYQKR